MRVAVLVKQIPRSEELQLVEGRLVRDGVELEVSAFCRRANAKAVELAGDDGEVVVFSMGPPSADDALREMLACGATRAVHLCDPHFAGSDTLATARALATAIRAHGPFDLVLCGLSSLDADTGQVGPEVAELLGVPFAPGVSELAIEDGSFRARLQTDDGHRLIVGPLPAVLSTAERLCDPSKASPEARALVEDDRITAVTAEDLGLEEHEVGLPGSPTIVGPPRTHEATRWAVRAASADEAIDLVAGLGAFETTANGRTAEVVPPTNGDGPVVVCFLAPDPDRVHAELLGEAAILAAKLGGSVTAVVPEPVPPALGPAGADRIVCIPHAEEPEQWATALADLTARELPWAVLVEGTRIGRAVASAVAARNGWGLTGDAVALEISDDGRLVAWKPAFGGQLIAPIESYSAVQMATVRPGVLPQRAPRQAADPPVVLAPRPGPPRLATLQVVRDDASLAALLRAHAVVGVGQGVDPQDYPLLEPLRLALGGAPLAATRKVTDRGWLPHSRQIGVTGHAIGPRLYVAVGISGKLNHLIGVRGAGVVLALNDDPSAPIFDHCDVGLVGDWHELAPALVEALAHRSLLMASTP